MALLQTTTDPNVSFPSRSPPPAWGPLRRPRVWRRRERALRGARFVHPPGPRFAFLCTHALNYAPPVWSAPTYPTGHRQPVGGYRDAAPEPDAEHGKPLPTAPAPVPPVPTTTMPHTPSPRQPQPLTQTTAPPPPAGAFVI